MARKAKDAGQAEVQETFDEATEKGFFGTGTPGKDREKFTVEASAGATDTNDDKRAAANVAPANINPNAGAPGEPLRLPEGEATSTDEDK